jgi:hypothetical protein
VGRAHQAREDANEGRLASAVRSEQQQSLARRDLQRDIVQRGRRRGLARITGSQVLGGEGSARQEGRLS